MECGHRGAPLLAGIRVLELGSMVAVPYAGKLMADLGAEVVKVEPLAGDPSRRWGPFRDDAPDPERSGLFLYLNANKSGVTLDLRSRAGRRVLLDLIPSYDVVLDDFVPAAREELGYDYEVVRRCNDQAISLTITPFGLTGPRKRWKAYSDTVSAYAGQTIYTGEPDREPLSFPYFLLEFQAGVAGAVAVMSALLAKAQLGHGQHIDLSTIDVIAAYHLGISVVDYLYGLRSWQRQGRRVRGGPPYPWTMLKCKDGDFLLHAATKKEWRRILRMMGDPAWGEDPRFQDRLKCNELYAEELDALIQPWLMQFTKQELLEMCYKYGVPSCPLKTAADLYADPHLAARGYFAQLDHPVAGTIRYPGSPFKLRNAHVGLDNAAPLLGADNARVYGRDLGVSGADIVRLRGLEVI